MPELGEGPQDIPVLFGLDDTAAGLRALLDRIEDLQARYAEREQEG